MMRAKAKPSKSPSRSFSKFLKPAVAVALALSIIAGFVYVLMQIKVRELVFLNNNRLKKEDLLYISKAKVGDKLFEYSSKDLYTHAKTSPWIKDLTVRKELTGSITFNIKEATPVAVLKLADEYFLVSEDAVVLERLKDNTLFLPIIREISPKENPNTYKEAVNIVNALIEKGIMQYDGSFVIYGSRPEDLSLYTGKMTIKIGSGDLDSKFKRLLLVKEEIEKRSMVVDYIDLRFAERVIVKSTGRAEPEFN